MSNYAMYNKDNNSTSNFRSSKKMVNATIYEAVLQIKQRSSGSSH